MTDIATGWRRLATRMAAGVAGLVVAAGMAGQAAAAEVTLRLHHFFPPTSAVHSKYFTDWKQRVESQSGGRIEVKIYPAMQLGGTPPSLFDQARTGQADIIWTVVGYTPDRFPEAEVFDLPFLPRSAEITSQAAHEFAMKHLTSRFEGVKVIAAHTHSPGLIHTRDREVRTPEDMKGLKLRGPSRLINSFIEALGAEPVGMPVPQTAEALSRGVIDGTVLPMEGLDALRLQELVHRHMVFAGENALYTTMMLVAMNQAKYDGLPADLKKVIDDNAGIAEARAIGRVMDQADAPVVASIEKSTTNRIIALTPEETDRFRAVGAEVEKAWAERMTARGIDGPALIEEAKALVAKYATQP